MRYTVDGIPPGKQAAFMPVLNACVSARATKWGMVKITGHPGDLAMPSPKPSAIPPGPLNRGAQPSYNSPDQWFPSVYYTTINGFHPADNTVRIRSTNEVPIPARRLVLVPKIAQRARRVGGLRQVTWPPAPQAWQNVNPGGVGG